MLLTGILMATFSNVVVSSGRFAISSSFVNCAVFVSDLK